MISKRDAVNLHTALRRVVRAEVAATKASKSPHKLEDERIMARLRFSQLLNSLTRVNDHE